MKFTHDDIEYTLIEPEQWTTLEAIQLERESGCKPAELVVSFQGGEPLGVHALVWMTLRRADVDVAWNELNLPWFDTVQSFSGPPVVAPEDPSTASTPERKGAGAGRGSRARSEKK